MNLRIIHIVIAALISGMLLVSTFGQTREAFLTTATRIENELLKHPKSKEREDLRREVVEFKSALERNISLKKPSLTSGEIEINNGKLRKFEDGLKAIAAKPAGGGVPANNANEIDVAREQRQQRKQHLEDRIKDLQTKLKNGSIPADAPVRDRVSNMLKTIETLDSQAELDRFEPEVKQLEGEIEAAEKSASWLPDPWTIFVYGVPSLIVMGLALVGGYLWRKQSRKAKNEVSSELSNLRRKQADLSQKLDAYMKVSTDLSQQLANHKSEIAKLKQAVSAQSSAAPFAPPPPPIDTYQREQPRFPVSVEDYLSKYGPGSIAVKYDYKEGMLVQDGANEGGLLVVQDDGRSLLVPSFGFFQTKSDYTNYFERYYSCERPMGGNVWIKQPASVFQTDGGWKLEAQGELEVR